MPCTSAFQTRPCNNKKRSTACDLIGQADRKHVISYSSFMHMTWRVQRYAILRKQVLEGRLSMLAGWRVCFGYDSGMIRAAYMTHEFRTPVTCFLRDHSAPCRTNQAPSHAATQLLKSARNHYSPKSYSATQLLKLSGMHAAAYT